MLSLLAVQLLLLDIATLEKMSDGTQEDILDRAPIKLLGWR